MKIGVVADSHLHQYEETFATAITSAFRDCELVLHAGDFVAPAIIDIFTDTLADKQFFGVCGNMDKDEVRRRFPFTQKILVAGKRFTLIHDLATLSKEDIFESDCVVFGHTHTPVSIVSGGVLFFNPGSSLNNRFMKEKTIGILEINSLIAGKIQELGV